MGTVIRPVIKDTDAYTISKERRYELMHFCLQYPEWRNAYYNPDTVGWQKTRSIIFAGSHPKGSYSELCI